MTRRWGFTGGTVVSLLVFLLLLMLVAPGVNAAGKTQLPRNSVSSKSIKNRNVKSRDLAPAAVRAPQLGANAVDGSKVADGTLSGLDVDEPSLDFNVLQRRLTGGCPQGEAVRSVDPSGDPTCTSIVGTLAGPVGGDLTGTLPNPTVAQNAINSLKVLNDSLTGSDVVESTLGVVPNADQLDGLNSVDFLLDSEATGFLEGTDSATGDLAGSTFNNLQVGPNALGGGDIDESTLGVVPNADQLDGVDYAAIDARLDALCAQADTINQEVRDLRSALNITALTAAPIGLDLSAVNLPDFDPAPCQG
jgi:hypothetical protein